MKNILLILSIVSILLIAGCVKSPNSGIAPQGFNDSALITNDSRLEKCNKLPGFESTGFGSSGMGVSISWPREGCYIKIAKEEKDPSICDKLNIYKDNCYDSLGEILIDPNLCSKIEEPRSKYYCYETISKHSKNLNICDNIPSTEFSYGTCLKNIALNSKKPNICDTIIGKQHDECYLEIVLEYGDKKLCNKMNDEINTQKCDFYDEVPSKCSETTWICYLESAIESSNYKICYWIDSVNSKFGCFRDIAMKLNEPSICDEILFSNTYREDYAPEARALCKQDVSSGTTSSLFNR
jgi:hypothetical protein